MSLSIELVGVFVNVTFVCDDNVLSVSSPISSHFALVTLSRSLPLPADPSSVMTVLSRLVMLITKLATQILSQHIT